MDGHDDFGDVDGEDDMGENEDDFIINAILDIYNIDIQNITADEVKRLEFAKSLRVHTYFTVDIQELKGFLFSRVMLLGIVMKKYIYFIYNNFIFFYLYKNKYYPISFILRNFSKK